MTRDNNTITITEIHTTGITFSDGSKITDYHDADCCEDNYADYEQLDDIAKKYNFHTPLKFEAIDEKGFRFGDDEQMFFVPCYSNQNGWYSSDIEIWYYHNGQNEQVLYFDCEMLD